LDGISIHDPKSINSAFNEYFVNIGNSLSNNISAATDCTFNEVLLIPNQSRFLFLRPIAVKEVTKYINNLNTSNSSGKFGIPIKYIKLSVNIIAPILTNIYNQCIQTGCFPDVLNIAEVVPLYKNGAKNASHLTI